MKDLHFVVKRKLHPGIFIFEARKTIRKYTCSTNGCYANIDTYLAAIATKSHVHIRTRYLNNWSSVFSIIAVYVWLINTCLSVESGRKQGNW